MIEVIEVSKSYRDKNDDEIVILKNSHLSVDKGSIISIIGASGSGKSTLLHLIGGLDKVDSGQIQIDNVDISSFTTDDIAHFRNEKIGFVFQFHHLLAEFTALENTAIPAMISGLSYAKATAKAKEYLSLVGMEHRFEHRPAELSGGEQQRVAIARSLINQPSVLLADEPTGNLDVKNSTTVLDLFLTIQQQTGVTMILVTHDKSIAQKTDITYELKNGLLKKIHSKTESTYIPRLVF
jgi:lipoprotein-releasing system ATP-binding protein